MKLRARVVLSLLLVVFLCFVSLNVEGFSFSSEKKKKGRDIADIPNPKTHPKECGRESVPQSSICDPDNLLTKDIKDEMEGYLNAMKEVEIAVVIISRMDLNGVTNKVSGTEKKAEIFARTLHDTWGVGDKETNKGVILFLSTSDRVIYFSTGDGVAKTLDSRVIESLISGMRQYLRRGDYGAAIIHTLIEMDLLLTRKIRSTYGHTKDTIPRSSSSGSDESFAESAIVFLMFFGFVGFAFYMNYSRNRQISGYERGRAQLDKLMKEVDQIKDHKYACSSCPICLEDFPTPSIPATTSTFPQETVVQTTTTTVSEETMTEKSNKEEDSSSSNTRSSSESSTSSSSSEKEEEPETINPPTARPVTVAEENTPSSSTSTSSSIPTSDSTTSTPTATATPAASNADAEKKPMALKCGHVFCRGCLEEYLTKADANNNKCPICRADIDDDPQAPNSTNTRPTSSTNTFRNRRGFFPFRRTNHIGTLWNYDSTTGTGFGTGTGLHYNQGAGTYTQTSNPFHHYAPELRYRLYRIHHYYPNAVTMEVLRSMNSAIDRGAVDELRNHVVNRGAELNRMVTEIRQAAQQSSRNSGMRGSYSSSFSGGRSSGGGGGRW